MADAGAHAPAAEAVPSAADDGDGADGMPVKEEPKGEGPGDKWFVGLMVQVLHEDGKWYGGQLTEFDAGRGMWHILFDDGDKDWYSLPDRDVRVVVEQQSAAWAAYLMRMKAQGTTKAQARDSYITNKLKDDRPKRRRPADVLAHVHTDAQRPLERWDPLSAGTYMDNLDTEEGGGGGKRKRAENLFPEKIRTAVPEAKLYTQLVELERKLDAISARKCMEFAEELKAPRATTRVLQLIVYNTHENQPGGGGAQNGGVPGWTLHITGKLDGEEQEGSTPPPFTDFFDRLFIELPPQVADGRSCVDWCRPSKSSGGAGGAGEGAPVRSFCITRKGTEECSIKMRMHTRGSDGRVSLKKKPELGALLGFHRGTWPALLLAFWHYVRDHGLQDESNALNIRLDERLQPIFETKTLPLTQVGERLREFTSEVEPLEIQYDLRLKGDAAPAVYELVVEAEDASAAQMRAFLSEEEQRKSGVHCAALDAEIEGLMEEIVQRKRKRDFMKCFADTPIAFLHEMTCALALDLETIRSAGSSQYCMFSADELLRAQVWQQPWTEEAVLHYLSMQGYEVNLFTENTLGEEDALQFAAQAIAHSGAAKAIQSGMIPASQEQQHRQQLMQAALSPVQLHNAQPASASSYQYAAPAAAPRAAAQAPTDAGDEEFWCEQCKRSFKSSHALAVHNATSAVHKKDKDKQDIPASSNKPMSVPMVPAAPTSGGYLAMGGSGATSGGSFHPGYAGQGGGGGGQQGQQGQQLAMWNELQKQMKSKGFSQEQIQDMYTKMSGGAPPPGFQ